MKLLLATLSLAAMPVLAAGGPGGYPLKPVTLVMPFAAGGAPDVYGRLIAEKLEKRIGQRIIVENRPGANSTLGTAVVAKSRPDGYTILYGTNSSLSAAPALFKTLSYDPVKDFAGISITVESYFALLVAPSEKNTTLAQFMDKVRKSPADHAFGGSSTTAEVINKLVQNAAKTDHTYVRYSSGANLWTDIIGGRLAVALQPVNGIASYVQAGTLHALAVSSPQRLPAYPDIPTLAETYPGVNLETWTGFFAPAGTPRPVIDYLYQNLAVVLKDPAVIKRSSEGGRGLAMTPEETDAFVRKEVPRWAELLKRSGIDPG